MELTFISWLMRHSAWCITFFFGIVSVKPHETVKNMRYRSEVGVPRKSWARTHWAGDKADEAVPHGHRDLSRRKSEDSDEHLWLRR